MLGQPQARHANTAAAIHSKCESQTATTKRVGIKRESRSLWTAAPSFASRQNSSAHALAAECPLLDKNVQKE